MIVCTLFACTDKQSETGRFQVVPTAREKVLLVDTKTGQTWEYGIDRTPRSWTPVAFFDEDTLPGNDFVYTVTSGIKLNKDKQP